MKLIDILQWAGGAGGVALLGLLFNQFNSRKTAEHSLIDKMTSQINLSDERYNHLVERVDKIEKENEILKNDNMTIRYDKTQIIAEKDRMEKELADKIEILTKENRYLKKRIKELESQLKENGGSA
ncbi:hypothetical protein AM4_123 [Lactococcus phage AM4]|uniref:Uncharacterized protein n=2 Tax=Audreyjarvisvirus AM4 TaxID=2845189 RepID=A0A1W6JKN0_9CAUD|nr:hypothetical protein H1Z35_gp128 [Lactococcus phage AM4]ARM66782.1 hypothetical protein AM4_123 [Lactococcus phage AM4]ARM67015.1 hypothetical protein AM5_162 [Lactococcus phage AM5]